MAEGMQRAIARQAGALNAEHSPLSAKTGGALLTASPAVRLRRLIRAHFDTLLGPGNDFVPVMLYEHRSLNAAQHSALARLQVAYESAWTPVLEALHASGQLRAPVKIARLLILGALNWSVQWFDARKGASLDELTNAAMALFIRES
jgi:hypothetical protein